MRPSTAAAQPPLWSPWDSQTYGKAYHGREITVFTAPKHTAGPSTTYRNDYPEPPLFWKHAQKPDHSKRPVGEFGHTTSHRTDYQPHAIGGNSTILRPYPEQKYHPKLSAVTTARDSYQQPKLPPARPRTAQVAYSTSDLPMGTTTMRDDYKQWAIPSRHSVQQPLGSKATKFHGTTTTRSDYNWPAEIMPPPSMYQAKTGNRPVPDFEGTTEYRVAYAPVPLPMGLPADIGVQVATKAYKSGGVGGQFELMIQQGAPAPQVASKTFTTVVDGQPSAAIVIVAKRSEYPHGVVLGSFTMEGIKAAPTGVPKVEVTLKLANEKTLHASAQYRNGKKVKSLTFQAKRGPNLRSVATADDIPED